MREMEHDLCVLLAHAFATVILEQRLFWGLVKGHGCFLCLLNLSYDYLQISTRLWHERMVYGIAMAIYPELIGHLNLQVNSSCLQLH